MDGCIGCMAGWMCGFMDVWLDIVLPATKLLEINHKMHIHSQKSKSSTFILKGCLYIQPICNSNT